MPFKSRRDRIARYRQEKNEISVCIKAFWTCLQCCQTSILVVPAFFVRCWEKRAKVTSIMKTRNSDVWHTNLTDLLSQSARSHKLNINPEISVRLKVLRWHFSEECVYGAAHNHFLLCSASSTFRHLFIFIWYSIYKVRSIFIPKIYTKSHE